MAAFIVYRTPRTFRATTHVTELSNKELLSRYRFTNKGRGPTQRRFGERNKEEPCTSSKDNDPGHAFPATGAFFNVVSDSMGYNKYNVSRLVDQVTDALLTRLRFVV